MAMLIIQPCYSYIGMQMQTCRIVSMELLLICIYQHGGYATCSHSCWVGPLMLQFVSSYASPPPFNFVSNLCRGVTILACHTWIYSAFVWTWMISHGFGQHFNDTGACMPGRWPVAPSCGPYTVPCSILGAGLLDGGWWVVGCMVAGARSDGGGGHHCDLARSTRRKVRRFRSSRNTCQYMLLDASMCKHVLSYANHVCVNQHGGVVVTIYIYERCLRLCAYASQ